MVSSKGKAGEDQMFGKAKGSAHEKDEQLPPAPQLQIRHL